jgi:hypothetical protein
VQQAASGRKLASGVSTMDPSALILMQHRQHQSQGSHCQL